MSEAPNKETRRIEVYDSGGMVVIDSTEGRFVFEPGGAVQFANALMHAAEACGAEIQIEVDKGPRITELKRATLIARTVHMLRSLQGKKPEYAAMQIVDTILSGIQ